MSGDARPHGRMSEVADRNRAYWETLAPHRPGESVEALRAGAVVLSPEELAAMGDVVDKRILQVAASVGDECLALALLGAHPTAVDVAAAHIQTGRDKALELGVEVDYRIGDMSALDEELKDFDVIYISWGGLCWVSDLNSWASDMAERLVPGGRLVIAEHHPLWETLSVTSPNSLEVTASYFDQDWRGPRDLAKEPEVVKAQGLETPRHTSFIWNVGQVATAMIQAGLSITTLDEYADEEMYAGLEASRHLPATYIAAGVRRMQVQRA